MTDVNDNAPQFTVSYIEIPVKENTDTATTVFMANAVDKDSGTNGEIRYTISEDPDNYFNIDALTGELRLSANLDFESKKQYTVKIKAYDLGKPRSLDSIMTLIVNVQDVNDNTPVFNQTSYDVKVLESIPLNTKFGHVNASDRDSGNNARITFQLKPGPDSSKFGIFPNDGYLYNKQNLDREAKDRYQLTVVATDNGIPPRSATADIVINVLDVNDNDPRFRESVYRFYVEENQPAATTVGQVSATDRDQTDNSQLKYYMTEPNENFAINSATGEIVTKRTMDREETSSYEFDIHVTDQGAQPRNSTANVKVTISDENDNSPSFLHSQYRAHVQENRPKGTSVIQVLAKDPDEGDNGTVSYSFSDLNNEDSKDFSIHPRSGWITTRIVLDHELRKSFTLTVNAIDQGQPKRSSSKSIEIIVDDVNDEGPVFERADVTITVTENTRPGTSVGSVKAVDADSGENGRVTYWIKNGNLFGTFGVNRTTGDIIIAREVDYEMCSSYIIQIEARDNSVVNPKSSNVRVNITVLDVNDNAPVFEENPVVLSIKENIPRDTLVWTFSAVDQDSGVNGKVKYVITAQSPSGNFFSIDEDTGELHSEAEIDYEVVERISVTVRATDQAVDPKDRLVSTVTALIAVEDMNDNRPAFKSRPRVDVFEDEPIGYPILHLIAVDEDKRENGRVSFAIISGNSDGNFQLDSATGLMSIAKMLDRERKGVYTMNISACDHGHPRQCAWQNLKAYVEDVNDNAPVFQHAVYSANISENESIDSLVLKIHATDSDTGKNAELRYLIPDGIAENKFSIGQQTGDITTAAILDREQKDNFVVTGKE